MKKWIGALAAAVVAFGAASQSFANVNINEIQIAALVEAEIAAGLNWKVGDKSSYSIDVGGFIKGTSNNIVREETSTGFWMVQDMDLGMQKSKAEILFNKSNGQIEKMLVDGKEQSIPKNNSEIVEMKESSINTKLGTFDCIYAKIRDKSDGKITEAWINPQRVPMSGMLKAIGDSQFGKVVQEIQSMQFAPRN